MRMARRPSVLHFAVAVMVLTAALAAAQEPAPGPSPEPSPSPEATPVPPPPPAGKIFNPDIAVIGNFLGAMGENDVDPRPSLEMEEAEVALQALVDPYARADFFLAFGPDGAEIEEAFLTFPTLPGGLLMKVGRLKASFGKVNTFHTHQISWTDRPLMNVNLLGGEEGLADSGISLSRLVPNSLLFLELTGEVFRGESELFQAPTRGDLAYGARLRAYRDLGEAVNVDLGSSFAYGHVAPGETARIIGVDATVRYRPLRRAIYRRFIARAEAVWRRDPAGLSDDAGSSTGDPSPPKGERTSRGAYFSAEYQFARRWFAGRAWSRK